MNTALLAGSSLWWCSTSRLMLSWAGNASYIVAYASYASPTAWANISSKASPYSDASAAPYVSRVRTQVV